MLSRRNLLISTSVLATGCGFLDSQSKVSGPRQETSLNLAFFDSIYSLVGQGVAPIEKYRQAVAELAEDADDPYGFEQGRYSLALRRIGTFPHWDEYAALLEDLEADLVTVASYDAQALGERGVLLPLDRFSGATGRPFDREYYPNVLAQFRANGTLYALPVGVRPQVLYYDAAQFRREGVPLVDSNWDWGCPGGECGKADNANSRRYSGALGAGNSQLWALVGPLAE